MRQTGLRWSFRMILAFVTVPLLAAAVNRGTQNSSVKVLQIGGQKIGFLKKAQVIDNSSNSQLKAEQFLTGLTPLTHLLSQAFSGQHAELGGFLLLTADYNQNIKTENEFTGNAHFTEVTFPLADAASKDPAYFSYVLQADKDQTKKGSGKTGTSFSVKQKVWLPSNFRLSLAGLNVKALAKVYKVSGLHATLTPGQPAQFDPISVTFKLDDQTAALVQHWFDTHKGKPVMGDLAFLGPNLKTVLGQLRLNEMVPESLEVNGNEYKVNLTVRKVAFTWSGSAA